MLVLALGGCANGYQQFYRPVPGVTPENIVKIRAAPPPATPLVDHIPAFDKSVLKRYTKYGYVAIGYSSFNSGMEQSDNFAITQGRAVGADLIVIANPKYTGSVTTSVPITTTTPITSYSSGSATAYGSKGFVNAYGIGTTTTYVPQTTYVPITINRQNYGAIYFIKPRIVLGALSRNLNDLERKSLQTNKGAVVTAVINDSPAFNADILIGDIITGINGQAVTSNHEFRSVLDANAGHTITLSVLREQKHLEKSVQLLPGPAVNQRQAGSE